MKINPGQSSATDPARKADSVSPQLDPRRSGSTRRTPRTDEVVLSRRAQLLRIADEAVQASDDVREDKVDEVRRKLEDGSYRIDAKRIAERLIDGQ